MSRTSMNEAVAILVDALPENRAVNPHQLSEQTGLNWKTIVKATEIITLIQERLLKEGITVDMERIGRSYILRKRKNLATMTPEARMNYITEAYFPEPDIEEILLVNLLKKETTSPEKAIAIKKDIIVQKLIQQGQFEETPEGKVYLSDEGILVAKGALKAYPQLK